MKNFKLKKMKNEGGFVMLFAVTLSSIVLAISLGVMNIALKELKFSTNAQDTNNAFFAADTGVEYALFHDKSSGSIYTPAPGTWNFILPGLGTAGQSCANVTVTKNSPPAVNTTIIADGFNIGDGSCNSTNPNRTQRELKTTYGNPIPDAISLVQINSSATITSPSSNLAFTGAVTSNNKIVVGITWSYGGCPPSISDTQGNLFTPIGTALQPDGVQYGYWFTAPVGSSGPDTVHISAGCGQSGATFIAEYSGIAVAPYDGNDGHTSTATPCSAGSITTNNDGDLVVGMFYDSAGRAITPAGGFTQRAINAGNAIYEEQIQNSAGPISATANCSANSTYSSTGFMIAFKHS